MSWRAVACRASAMHVAVGGREDRAARKQAEPQAELEQSRHRASVAWTEPARQTETVTEFAPTRDARAGLRRERQRALLSAHSRPAFFPMSRFRFSFVLVVVFLARFAPSALWAAAD